MSFLLFLSGDGSEVAGSGMHESADQPSPRVPFLGAANPLQGCSDFCPADDPCHCSIRLVPHGSIRHPARYGRITLKDASGTPSAIPLGAPFTFVVHTNTTHLSATVTYNGVVYSAIAAIGAYWAQVRFELPRAASCEGDASPDCSSALCTLHSALIGSCL